MVITAAFMDFNKEVTIDTTYRLEDFMKRCKICKKVKHLTLFPKMSTTNCLECTKKKCAEQRKRTAVKNISPVWNMYSKNQRKKYG